MSAYFELRQMEIELAGLIDISAVGSLSTISRGRVILTARFPNGFSAARCGHFQELIKMNHYDRRQTWFMTHLILYHVVGFSFFSAIPDLAFE